MHNYHSTGWMGTPSIIIIFISTRVPSTMAQNSISKARWSTQVSTGIPGQQFTENNYEASADCTRKRRAHHTRAGSAYPEDASSAGRPPEFSAGMGGHQEDRYEWRALGDTISLRPNTACASKYTVPR